VTGAVSSPSTGKNLNSEIRISKVDGFLSYAASHVGEWVCSVCATGSNQPAAIFREAKKRGFVFEEPAPNRWATSRHCEECGETRSHYRLLKETAQFSEKKRLSISSDQRRRILKILDHRDAFTGASISSVAEIDHKIPWTRLDHDIDASKLNDAEIRDHFQLLTREHNALKDRHCGTCKASDVRPPFFAIPYWYAGGRDYKGTCEGCGWYDGEKWRLAVSAKLTADSGTS
jgi:hypothetical protein